MLLVAVALETGINSQLQSGNRAKNWNLIYHQLSD